MAPKRSRHMRSESADAEVLAPLPRQPPVASPKRRRSPEPVIPETPKPESSDTVRRRPIFYICPPAPELPPPAGRDPAKKGLECYCCSKCFSTQCEIFMYRDLEFCSVECRERKMVVDVFMAAAARRASKRDGSGPKKPNDA